MTEETQEDKRRSYPSDLSDEEWALLEPLLPAPAPTGRPPTDPREVVNAILYITKTGVQWAYLPHDFPPKSTVYDRFAAWKKDGTWQSIVATLTGDLRLAQGREQTPSLVLVDSQSAQNSGRLDEHRGFDGGKGVRGRKRHYLVDTLGLLLAVLITGANTHDSQVIEELVQTAMADHSGLERLEVVLGDGSYQGQQEKLSRVHPEAKMEVVLRQKGDKGFVVQVKRWIVERSISWKVQNRRLTRDHEFLADSSRAFIHIAAMRHNLRALARVSG
jgi:putative transposase